MLGPPTPAPQVAQQEPGSEVEEPGPELPLRYGMHLSRHTHLVNRLFGTLPFFFLKFLNPYRLFCGLGK